jgi:DNA processing protein
LLDGRGLDLGGSGHLRERPVADGGEPLWDELDLFDVPSPPAGPVEPFEVEDDGGSVEARIVGLLGPSPVAVDDLARQAAVPVRTVQSVLAELELAGRVERHGGNLVSSAAASLRG